MKKALLIFSATTVILFLPILFAPNLFLDRGNDLQEFFWPLFYYTKTQLLSTGELPLWNNMFLSGVPLLPDPQAPLFYLPNIILLLLPINFGLIVSAILHTTWGGIGAYLVSSKALGFTKKASIIAGILYILTPRLSGFIEAGHMGLIFATAWIPLVLLATINLAKKANINWSILLAISLASIFYTHPTTFVLSAILSPFVFLASFSKVKRKEKMKSILLFALGAVVTFGLIAITFLPQLSWVPNTNRFLLATDREVWPRWTSWGEYIKSISNPIFFGIEFANNLDTEKWIALGTVVSGLTIAGLIKLFRDRKSKAFFLLLLGLVITVLSANNISPISSILIDQDWFVYARVATRSWFIISLISIFLTIYLINSTKMSRLTNIILATAIIELLVVDWSRLAKPIENSRVTATKTVYEYIKKDPDRFRVFCTTRCFSQRDVAKYGLETIGGYSTLHQKNYYQQAWQLTGVYWDYYTLTLPPIGSYKYGRLNPDYEALGVYNTKYIVSPYEISNSDLETVERVNDFYIYKNKKYLPRAYFANSGEIEKANITFYSPNKIVINVKDHKESQLIVSEVYSPDWSAYLNGAEKVDVQETPNALGAINIKPSTNFITLIYKPESYKRGKMITIVTIVVTSFLLAKSWKKQKKTN